MPIQRFSRSTRRRTAQAITRYRTRRRLRRPNRAARASRLRHGSLKQYSFNRLCLQPGLFVEAGTVAISGSAQQTWTVPASATTYFSCRIRLIDIPNLGEYVTLFDRMRISRVVYTFEFLQNSAEASVATTTNHLPTIRHYADYDGTGATGLSVADRQGVSTFHFGSKRTLSMSYRPRIIVVHTDASTGITFRTPQPAPWMDMNTTVDPRSIEYVGRAGAVYNTSTTNMVFVVTARLYFQCQQQR